MISLHALDTLTADHIRFEYLCSKCLHDPSAIGNPPTDPQVIHGLHRLRDLVMDGSIDAACQIAESITQHPLSDPRLQLNIRIHKMFELLHVAENIPHNKNPDAHNTALQRALKYSQQLAGFALNAFPEAYAQFTESMMLFAYPESASTLDAIQKRRQKLADQLVSVTRMTAYARESRFSFLMRYLLLIYVQFKSPVITPGQPLDPLDKLICDLFLCASTSHDRATRITWKTDLPRPSKFSHRAEYKEADVQALPERVNISRQESIESLHFTDGNVTSAIQNELGRVVINRGRLRALVVEYCAARGHHVFEIAEHAPSQGIQEEYPAVSSEHRIVISRHLVSSASLDMFTVLHKLRALAENDQFDEYLQALREVDPAVTGDAPLLDFRVAQCRMMRYIRCGKFDAALQVSQQTLGPLAKRYPEFLPYLMEISTLLVFAADLENIESRPKRQKARDSGEKVASSSDLEEQRSRRGGDKRIRHTRDVDKSLPSGEVQPFEDFLGDAFQYVSESASLEAITSEVYNAYEAKLGEPQLLQLLKRLVSTHEEWQTHNMMTDNYATAMGISEVRGVKHVMESPHCSEADKKSGHGRSDGSTDSEGGSDTQEAGSVGRSRNQRREIQRETMVLTLMEFLAISRAEALAIVRNHPHAQNAQAILDTVLSNM
eukprot:GFKZ01005570.1.p1 GENE.GFKZ01005570.1~~GFKZ01005570.1.p1  ORF type:complete len:663 (-),score=75.75 GFKZ01005570.1:436-2424(-)